MRQSLNYKNELEEANKHIDDLNERADRVEEDRYEDAQEINELNREIVDKDEQIEEARKQIETLQEWAARAGGKPG